MPCGFAAPVGEVRLSSLDVGFDLRATGTAVSLPDTFSSVGIEEDGQVFLLDGSGIHHQMQRT
ncbi:hypothetical protein M0R72_07535 [Candidatus Pacearchaeota archaeon]|nr:hypothetical protein [Candidatus Pacearchaeota archaeon]